MQIAAHKGEVKLRGHKIIVTFYFFLPCNLAFLGNYWIILCVQDSEKSSNKAIWE